MEHVIAAAVVTVLARMVTKKLVSITMENGKLIFDFQEVLKNVESSFVMIQEVLYDAGKRQVSDSAVKRWLENLEDLAFETDHVLDKFKYVHFRRSTVKNKAELIFSRSNYFSRLKFGRKIRDINKKLESINKEAHSFGLQRRFAGAPAAADPNASATASLETDSFAADPIFLGRDNDVSAIVEMLITQSRTDQFFSVVPIVGMGGSGKTTLARKVYHDAKIRSHFGERSWVYVSQSFDPIIVFKKLLTTLTSQTDEVELREKILENLKEALLNKMYLLVLDDVWYQDGHVWERFMNSLSGVTSTTGNVIIVTTRNTKVASNVNTLQIHSLKGLSDEDCWSIIKEKSSLEEFVPSVLETIGKKIAKRCQGSPLAANVVGGVLRGKSGEEWLQIETDRRLFVEDFEIELRLFAFTISEEVLYLLFAFPQR